MGILFADCLHVSLNRNNATIALTWITTLAWLDCLGAGAAVQDAGGTNCAEAAEVQAGLHHLLLVAPLMPCKGCMCCGGGAADRVLSLGKKILFLVEASDIQSNSSARGTRLQRQQLIVVIFRWMQW